MRIAILANSLPHALKIYNELESLSDCDLYILLCNTPGQSPLRHLLKNIALWVLKSERVKIMRLLFDGKIVMLSRALDHPRSLKILRSLRLDVGLHKTGIIYREPTINSFRLGILNPHIGILPEYRGRCVMEWALLSGEPVGITLFFIDGGIDTGERILLSEEVDISHCKSIDEAKEYLFGLDASYFRKGIELLRREDSAFKLNDRSGRRYYVMSRLFQDVVNQLIKSYAKK